MTVFATVGALLMLAGAGLIFVLIVVKFFR